MLVALEERERIETLVRDGEALRDHGYRTNAAFAGGDPLAAEARSYEARLAADDVLRAAHGDGAVAVPEARDAHGYTAAERAKLDAILSAMFRAHTPSTPTPESA